LLRPLISTSKAEILRYVRENNIPYVTDETNFANEYARNFLRNEIMPRVAERWNGVDGLLNNLAREARELSDFLDSLINESLLSENGAAVRLDITALAEPALAPRYVFKALKKIGIDCDVERNNIGDIIALKDKNNGAVFEAAGAFRVIKEYGSLAFVKSEVNIAPPQTEIPYGLLVKNGYIEIGGVLVTRAPAALPPDKGAGTGLERRLYLDESKIPDGAVLRFKRAGDVFEPFGGGTKKLKEYLIDKKIPQRLRGGIPLICSGGEVLCVLGTEISDGVRAGENSRTVELCVKRGGCL
jgi:tRNA(Ile)-lysidine synthase